MNFSLSRAFTFVFQEDRWFLKLFIGSVFMAIGSLLSLFQEPLSKPETVNQIQIVVRQASSENSFLVVLGAVAVTLIALMSILANFVPIGYMYEAVHNEMLGGESLLPDWKGRVWEFLHKGSASFFFGVAIWLVAMISIVFITMLVSISKLAIVFYLVVAAVAIVFSAFIPALMLSFCTEFKLKDYFNLKKAYQIIKLDTTSYIVALCALIGFSVLTYVAAFISCITVVGILFIPLVFMYFSLVSTNILAQIYRNGLAKQKIDVEIHE